MEQSLKFLPLLLVLLLAFVVPLLLSRLRWMPLVVGEIIVGILIGPSVFNLIGRDMTLDFFAEIGLALLMFLSGLEIDFSLITQSQPDARAQPSETDRPPFFFSHPDPGRRLRHVSGPLGDRP